MNSELLFLFSGNLNDVIPECPRTSYRNGRNDFQVMFLKRTRQDDVFEIEFKLNEDVYEHFTLVVARMYETCSSKRKALKLLYVIS